MNHPTSQVLQNTTEFLESALGQKLFGTRNAVQWFERVNRKELVESGVLFKNRKQWLRSQPEYDAKVMEILRSKSRQAVCK